VNGDREGRGWRETFLQGRGGLGGGVRFRDRGAMGQGTEQGLDFKGLADEEVNVFEGATRGSDFLGVGGEHDNVLPGGALLDGGGELAAGHRGHVVVGEDVVELARLELGQGVGTVVGLGDAVAAEFKDHLNGLADEGFVVHDQDVAVSGAGCIHDWSDGSRFYARG
jgi:hypothetical protein